MTARMTVREVREALLRRAVAGQGAASTMHLGRIFHETFAGLIGDDPRWNASTALAGLDTQQEQRTSSLTRHSYEKLVGPRLRQDLQILQGQGEPLLKFWRAVESLCDWIAGLPDLTHIARPEVSLTRTLQDPGWSGPVVLSGVADAVIQTAPGKWCVVELKLGRNAPEADLAQVLLYQLMLSAGDPSEGDIALISFGPERSERVFRARELQPIRAALFNLIGRLAGVRTDGQTVPPAVKPLLPDRSAQGNRLVAALAEYGVAIRLEGPPIVGSAFIRYHVGLQRGVKLSSVEARAAELQLRLGLDAPPRIALEGGKVVIDLQRLDRESLPFESIRARFLERIDPEEGCSRLPVGVALDGSLTVADLSKPEHAHLLVAGTTGSGKSEWLRTALAGLILANTPETLRLVIIDPKRNAFPWLKESPFLLRPIVHPSDTPASDVLAELIEEMEERYRLLESSGSDTIMDHVRKTGQALPRILCVCDEYADLILSDRNERRLIEEQIARLGAKARAAGIHLILATQRPSREVIRGAIDANIPARVGLHMSRSVESRMLLGEGGAETLLGRGDLLFKDIGEPVRLQAALLEEEQRDRLARHGGPAVRV